MRILFMNSIKAHNWRGGEKWMTEAAAGLASRGHMVRLAVRPGSVIAKRAGARGIEVFPMSYGPDIDPYNALRLRRFIKKNRIELVCTNFDKELRIMALAGLFTARPVVVARKGLPYIFDKWHYRLTYARWVDHIVSPSKAIARKFRELPWLDGIGITAIPNGVAVETRGEVDSSRSIRSDYGIPPECTLVGFVGDLCRQKGVDTLLRAFSSVTNDCRLLVIGDGGERTSLEALAHDLSLGGRVIFTGHLEDAPRLYEQLDMVVCPSLFEGMPNVVLEAMAAGLPVIATSIDGVTEIIDNDGVGLLVPPKDEEALATAIAELAGDKGRRRVMGEAARTWVSANFSIEKTVDRIEELFQRLIREKRSQGRLSER